MIDHNNNGIPDNQEFIFNIVKAGVLVWSMGMLSLSYFSNKDIDRTFFATTMTASAASFGIKKTNKSEPTRGGRTETPRELRHK